MPEGVTLTQPETRAAYEEIRATFTRMDMTNEVAGCDAFSELDTRLIVTWWRELRLWYMRG